MNPWFWFWKTAVQSALTAATWCLVLLALTALIATLGEMP